MKVLNRLNLPSVLTQIIKAQFCDYKYPYNINREEHASYLKKVERAQKDINYLKQSNLIPRRKRRIYDQPKHDLDLTNYSAWRIYNPDQMLCKFWAHGSPVAAKIQLQPKWVIHAFGIGLPPMNHYRSANLQFSFEDNNFSKFLLYQYRNTTDFAQNIPNYNYEDQSKVPEKRRKQFRLDPKQFWKSEEYFEFRLNCSSYAEHLKFKKWVIETVEASKSKVSYDQFINKKFGTVINFNTKEQSKYFEPAKPAILSLTPLHYNLPKKGEKLKEPKVEVPKKLGEEYRIIPKKTEAVKEEEKKKVAEVNAL